MVLCAYIFMYTNTTSTMNLGTYLIMKYLIYK